jgi:hypothetical protein
VNEAMKKKGEERSIFRSFIAMAQPEDICGDLCPLCIFASDKDVTAVAQHDPEALALVSNLERKTASPMKSGRSLMQILQTEREHIETAEEQRCLALVT